MEPVWAVLLAQTLILGLGGLAWFLWLQRRRNAAEKLEAKTVEARVFYLVCSLNSFKPVPLLPVQAGGKELHKVALTLSGTEKVWFQIRADEDWSRVLYPSAKDAASGAASLMGPDDQNHGTNWQVSGQRGDSFVISMDLKMRSVDARQCVTWKATDLDEAKRLNSMKHPLAETTWTSEQALGLAALASALVSSDVAPETAGHSPDRAENARAVDSLEPLPQPERGQVLAVRTCPSANERFAVLPPLRLKPGDCDGQTQVILDSSVRYQSFLGVGTSFTESAAEEMAARSEEVRKKVIQAYFSRVHGIGLRLARVHINSCDFSRGNWDCLSTPDDKELTSFTLDRYEAAILPILREAKDMVGSEELLVMASPWSPPSFMKTTGNMCKGGVLRSDMSSAWANYYVRFAREMERARVPLWALTVQNEPMGSTDWENCIYSADAERSFVRDHLGPTLESSGLDIKLLIWDHNRDEMLYRAKVIYSDPDAAKYVWGLGFHWYGDPEHEKWPDQAGQVCFDSVKHVHELRPDKHLVMTEACQEQGPHFFDWRVAERYGLNIIKDLNNWCEAWIDWNLCLNMEGGPNHVGNNCSAPIHLDPGGDGADGIIFQPSFFYLGHFSRYILPGAQRIMCSSGRDAIKVTAFANPDGTLACVLMNVFSEPLGVRIIFHDQNAEYHVPAHSITTLLLLDTPPEPEDVKYLWTENGIKQFEMALSFMSWPYAGSPFRDHHLQAIQQYAPLNNEAMRLAGFIERKRR